MYLQLLAVTCAMTVGGIVCQLVLREARGARTFLGLSLAMVPINAAALGGLFYSMLSGGEGASSVAQTLTLCGSVVLLLGVIALSLRALARRHARELTLAIAATSATLLLPFRGVTAVLCMLVVGAVALAWIDRQRFSPRYELRTFEGRWARAVAAAPFVFLLGRTFLYYEVSFEHGLVVMYLAPLLCWLAASYLPSGAMKTMWHAAGLPLLMAASLGAALFWGPLPAVGIFGEDVGIRYVVSFGLISGLGLLFSSVVVRAWADVLQRAAAWVVLVFVGYALLLEAQGVGLSVISTVLVGAGVATYAFVRRLGPTFVAASLVAVSATIAMLVQTITVEAFTHWATLAALGVVAIVGASVYERQRSRIVRLASGMRSRFAAKVPVGGVQ
jgi:hypothetical protein